MNLFDADVCIDLLRKHPPSVQWFATLRDNPGVPGFAAIELVVGCRDKTELQRVRKFLKKFVIVWPQEADMERALLDYAPFALSDGIQGMDALIAATAAGINATLYTFNVKHFRVVPGLVTEQPYQR